MTSTLNVPEPTIQEAYDRIREWFSRPGAERSLADGVCRYRATGKNGEVLKCAMGVLIPDEVYDPAWEFSLEDPGLDGGQIARKMGWRKRGLIDFVEYAQRAHDHSGYGGVMEFLGRLDNLAQRYGLKVPE